MSTTNEQLSLIESMIANAKGDISEGSVFYLLWGYLAIAAAIIQYILLIYTDFPYSWISWPILMGVGGIASFLIGKKQSSVRNCKSYIDDSMFFLWVGVVASIFLLLFMIAKIGTDGVYPIIILLYGLGTFVSGGILKFLPLKIGGICCWIIGALAIYMDFSTQILLIVLALLISYIIPGHMLSNYKKNV